MPKIKLQTCDNELFEVDYDTLKCSSILRDMVENLDIHKGVDERITLPNIGSDVFRKFIEWIEHHKDDPILNDNQQIIERRQEEISSWDADFLNMDQDQLFELTLVADYLRIGALLEITCEKLACLIEDETPEEVRKAFNIENDLSPDEEEQIRRENELTEER